MKLVFLLDVDNTHLDNDRVKFDRVGDLRALTLDQAVSPGSAGADGT